MGFTESVVEDAALAWLEALGYAVLHGPDIAAGEPGAERSDQNYRDVVLERRLVLVEAKASRTIYPGAAKSMLALTGSIRGRTTECIVVHAATGNTATGTALEVGARAMGVEALLETLRGQGAGPGRATRAGSE